MILNKEKKLMMDYFWLKCRDQRQIDWNHEIDASTGNVSMEHFWSDWHGLMNG